MHNRTFFSRLAIIIGSTALAAGVIATPAGAKPPPNSHLAGYGISIDDSSMSGTMVVPSYTCKPKDNVVAQVASYDNTAEVYSGSNLYLACAKHNVPTLSVGLDVDGTFTYPAATIRPGDTVVISMSCGGSGTTVGVDDTTSESSVSASSANPSDCSGGGVGMDGVTGTGHGGQTNLPQFGSLQWTAASINGSPLGDASPTPVNYYEGKKNVITVGALNGSGGFTETQGA
jgi:hypothetical protein